MYNSEQGQSSGLHTAGRSRQRDVRAVGCAGSGTSRTVLQTARPIWLERHVSSFQQGTSIQSIPGLRSQLPHRAALT